MKLIRLVIGVGSLTLVSRIFGYIRDVLLAFFLGASVLNDIFIIALRLPNMFRTIFGEGALSAAFVPILSKKIKSGSQNDVKQLVQGTQNLLILCLIALSSIMIIFMPLVVTLLAPGYSSNPELFDLAVDLSRIAFPYIIFISLMAFYGGVANCYGNYFYFASAPIWLNIVLIIFVMFGDTALSKTYYLSYGLLVAGIIEMLWVYQLIYKRFGYLSVFKMSVTNDIKVLLKKMLPGIFGSGIAQINLMITTILCSFIPSGISFLYYADRISQLPLALLGTALGTVLLPELSKRSQEIKKFKAIQSKAYIFALFISLPITALLIGLSQEIVELLFEHGSFDHTATIETAAALTMLAIALPMFILIKVLTSCFFALGDTRTPVIISAISLPLNILVGLISLPIMRHVGIAFASVISSYFIVVTLAYLLNKKGGMALYAKTIKQSLKIASVSLMMLALIYIVKHYISSHIIIKLGACSALCILFYLLSNRYFIGLNIRKFIKS